MARAELPSFDLVVATVDRVEQLERLLDSLSRQSDVRFRVLVVDQNDDDRLVRALSAYDLDLLHVRSPRGLSRGRNAALHHLAADVVAFPDDDCVYDDDLLERVGRYMLDHPDRDGLTGRAVDLGGRSTPSWKSDPALLTDENLWNRAISFTIFLRRTVMDRIGGFDEQLGLGSGSPWSSGEEIELLVRAVRSGAQIAYDPTLTVTHEDLALDSGALRDLGYRDGASVGYILGKHRYPARVVARMLVRPAGGALVSLLHGDTARARRHAETLRGRVVGYRRGAQEAR